MTCNFSPCLHSRAYHEDVEQPNVEGFELSWAETCTYVELSEPYSSGWPPNKEYSRSLPLDSTRDCENWKKDST